MKPRIRSRTPASIGSNQAGPANSAGSPVAVVLSSSMAWSPPALERRAWLVEQAGDYAAPISHHIRDGTNRDEGRAVVRARPCRTAVTSPPRRQGKKGWSGDGNRLWSLSSHSTPPKLCSGFSLIGLLHEQAPASG